MNRLGILLGSSTRANFLEGLALSDKPLTSYRLAKGYNMNIAKTYAEAKNLLSIGVVRTVAKGRGVEYSLADDEVRRLVLRLTDRVVPYASWSTSEAKAARFRLGMKRVPRLAEKGRAANEKPSRLPGELDALALLGRRRFDAKYRRRGDGDFASV